MIKLHDLYFKPFISEQEIQATVQNIVDAIVNDLGDEMPVFVGILNGSFMLVSDFVKKYPKPCEVTFIKVLQDISTIKDDGTEKTKELIKQTKALHDLAETADSLMNKLVNQKQNWLTKSVLKLIK
ncbi:hypothetical protein OAE07_05150 [Winogradskyella sp.]|nr:hypothetical protein [Winogradskyella sp.]